MADAFIPKADTRYDKVTPREPDAIDRAILKNPPASDRPIAAGVAQIGASAQRVLGASTLKKVGVVKSGDAIPSAAPAAGDNNENAKWDAFFQREYRRHNDSISAALRVCAAANTDAPADAEKLRQAVQKAIDVTSVAEDGTEFWTGCPASIRLSMQTANNVAHQLLEQPINEPAPLAALITALMACREVITDKLTSSLTRVDAMKDGGIPVPSTAPAATADLGGRPYDAQAKINTAFQREYRHLSESIMKVYLQCDEAMSPGLETAERRSRKEAAIKGVMDVTGMAGNDSMFWEGCDQLVSRSMKGAYRTVCDKLRLKTAEQADEINDADFLDMLNALDLCRDAINRNLLPPPLPANDNGSSLDPMVRE